MTFTTIRERTGSTARGAAQATRGRLRQIGGAAEKGIGAARARTAGSVGTVRARSGRRLDTVKRRAGRRIRDTRRTVGYRIAGQEPPSTARRVGTTLAAGAIGAAIAFFLDPVSGKRRRHLVRDKVGSAVRAARERASRRSRYLQGQAVGALEETRRAGTVRIPENDQTLAHKVESEAIGYAGVPSGRVNVNAEKGVVILRGQVDTPGDARRIEKLVREVDGVRGVENLLHTPDTSAPNTPTG
jgi:osmotically-inducible protein OsmY